jgi:mannose PTS system EIID component
MKPRLGGSLLRLFTVQGSWTYERMIGLGAGVAEEPLLRDLPGGPEGAAYHAAVARGARFFNAHPYLAGLAVGATARAEYDGASPEQIERLRSALTGPLGSLGDRLVWAGWLPFTSALALAAVALGLGWRAIAGFLVLYNAGHVALRWWALRSGWAHGARVAVALHHPWLRRATSLTVPAMAVAMGLALPLASGYLAAPLQTGGGGPAALAGSMALGVILLVWRPAGLTGLRLGLTMLAAALIVGWVWR